MGDAISKLAPEFAKLTKEMLFGDIWKRPGLTAREKSLVKSNTISLKLEGTNRFHQISITGQRRDGLGALKGQHAVDAKTFPISIKE